MVIGRQARDQSRAGGTWLRVTHARSSARRSLQISLIQDRPDLPDQGLPDLPDLPVKIPPDLPDLAALQIPQRAQVRVQCVDVRAEAAGVAAVAGGVFRMLFERLVLAKQFALLGDQALVFGFEPVG